MIYEQGDPNQVWRSTVRAKQDAISDAEPLEDRTLMFNTDGPRQRQRVWECRAKAGVDENPSWTVERIAEEYGTSVELVEEYHRRTHGGVYKPKR